MFIQCVKDPVFRLYPTKDWREEVKEVALGIERKHQGRLSFTVTDLLKESNTMMKRQIAAWQAI